MEVSRRDFMRTAAAATLVSNATKAVETEEGNRYNLLWIMTDQQPVSTLHAYGNSLIETPNLDRIADEGIRFDRFYVSAFPCSPSRACFLTGREAHHHGVTQNDVPLADTVPCLGDILKGAGYATGYVGKWHLSGHMYRGTEGQKPFEGRWYYEQIPNRDKYAYKQVEGGTGEDEAAHGFDRWVGGWAHYRKFLHDLGLRLVVAKTAVGNHNCLPSGPDDTHAFSRLPQDRHMAAFLANHAVSFIEEQAESATPFALVLSFYGPHLPVAPPVPWDNKYPLAKIPLPANHHDDLKGKPVGQRTNGRCYKLPTWTEEQFRDYVRRYWGYCSYIDHQIGRVLDALEAVGKADNTIVLFTSDHGDMVASHGFVYKLTSCGYDELLRVPFLLRCPGRVKPGSTSDAFVNSVDVLPTLLGLMDVPAPKGVDGRSFLPLLEGRARRHRRTVICNSGERNLTMVTDRWKYVLNWNPCDLDELYDLEQDPGEMNNLITDKNLKTVRDQMRHHIEGWLEETEHPYKDTILATLSQAPERRLVDLWPEITDFQYSGNGAFEYKYVWHAVDQPPKDMKYWSFTHFANPSHGKDGDIVFRDTRWPQPPTMEWQRGQDYALGPVRVKIPGHAGSGAYQVRIGLYNPDEKTTPGYLLRGQGNSVVVGTLTVEKEGEQVMNVTFTRDKNLGK